jgi:ribosomal protein L40E
MRLYHHRTDGGAEYLFDTYIQCDYCNKCKARTPDDGKDTCDKCGGAKHREGRITDDTKYIVRIDGDIEVDAELNVRE